MGAPPARSGSALVMQRNRPRRWLAIRLAMKCIRPGAALLSTATLLSWPLFAGASDSPSKPSPAAQSTAAFDIPPQSLMSAVETFAATTGIQVLYDRPVGDRPASPGVHGRMSPEAALAALLKGTGLVARFTDTRDVVLHPLESASPSQSAAPSDLPKLSLSPLRVEGAPVIEVGRDSDTENNLYAVLIRTDVRQALAKSVNTSRDTYDAILELWIAPKGEIQHVSVIASSGKALRDLAILKVVGDLQLDAPPPVNLPQPVRITVHARRP